MAALSSAANYYNHRTFPGLVNWLFVLTEPELTGELGDGDRKGTHSGGIIRWLGRPSSQLKPIFHARGRRRPPPPKGWQPALLTGAVTVFKSITDLYLLRSSGERGLGADPGHHPDRPWQGRQDLPDKDSGARVSFYWHTWRSLKTPNVTSNKSSRLGPHDNGSQCA